MAFESLHGRRICLITSGNVGSNPRLVKEANALVATGAIVHVVSLNRSPDDYFLERDSSVALQAGWSWRRIDMASSFWRYALAFLHRVARHLYRMRPDSKCFAFAALHPAAYFLARAAASWKADLYIAHNLPALPAACVAATKHGAKLGFDAEDFHSGELSDVAYESFELKLTREIERRYLPMCDYLTAASPGIALAYANEYALASPTVVLNVFPKSEAPLEATPCGSQKPAPSLYWFSQTIGPNRGLDVALRALARAKCRPHLYIRGTPTPRYLEQIRQLADDLGVSDRLHVLSPGLPGDMVRLAAQYDLGIAGEVVSVINRDICLSNKIFTYLQAGIPSLVSDTRAQQAMAQELGEVAQAYPQQDAEDMAQCVDAFFGDRVQLAALRQRAWELGQTRYNWENESLKFLLAVARALGSPLNRADISTKQVCGEKHC